VTRKVSTAAASSILAPASAREGLIMNAHAVLGDEITLAGEEPVETLFVDCEPGSVPAFGAAYGLGIVIDDSLTEQPDLYVESGDHANLIHLSGDSFQSADARCSPWAFHRCT
jgi:Ala-tRNA(Pro) deacylase